MTQAALTKLWTAVGAVLAFLTIDTWLLTQGGTSLFDAPVLDDREVPAAYFASLVIGALLALVCNIGRLFAKRSPEDRWYARLPVVWLDDLDAMSKEGRRYQIFFLAAFVVLPALSLAHFNDKVLGSGRVVSTVTKADPKVVSLFYIPPLSEILTFGIFRNAYCLGQDLDDFANNSDGRAAPCRRTPNWPGGVTWFPIVSPLLMGGFTLWGWIATVRLIRLLSVRQSQAQHSSEQIPQKDDDVQIG